MLVAGSSGIGKTYFAANFVWRLFHPDGVHLKHVPDTIVCRPQPNNKEGFIYHKGSFFREMSSTPGGELQMHVPSLTTKIRGS
jgi:hypothetical protein